MEAHFTPNYKENGKLREKKWSLKMKMNKNIWKAEWIIKMDIFSLYFSICPPSSSFAHCYFQFGV